MSEYNGLGQTAGEDPSRPPIYRSPLFRILYVSLLAQASLSYIFFALGAVFSSNSFRNHLVGIYAFVFGVVSLCYHLSYQPVVDRVNLFFPKLDEDIVKHTFYFLIGIPGVTDPDSFQYQLASIIFATVGFVGTLISFRHQNLLSSFVSGNDQYQEP